MVSNNDFSASNIYSSYFFYFSIMPETFIEPHKVLSPLPKPVKPVKKQTKKRAKKGGNKKHSVTKNCSDLSL